MEWTRLTPELARKLADDYTLDVLCYSEENKETDFGSLDIADDGEYRCYSRGNTVYEVSHVCVITAPVV